MSVMLIPRFVFPVGSLVGWCTKPAMITEIPMLHPRHIFAGAAAILLAAALVAVWLAYGVYLQAVLFVALLAGLALALTAVTLGMRAWLRRLALRELAPGASALLLDNGPARYVTPHQPAPVALPQAAPIDVTPVVVAAPPPHWTQLTRPGALLFGSGDDGAAYAELAYCAGIAICGQPRSGKTTLARLLLAQAAQQDATLIVCDPHGARPDSLLASLDPLRPAMQRAATSGEEIADAIALACRIADTRLHSSAQYPPLVVVIDELTSLVLKQTLDYATLARLAALVVEPAKVRMHIILIGHDWSAKTLGSYGAVLRRAVTHRAVLRSDIGNADLLLPTALAKQAARLERGTAIIVGDDAPQTVRIPQVSAADLAAVAPRRALPLPWTPQGVRQCVAAVAPAAAAPTERLPEPRQRDLALDALRAKPGMTPLELATHMGWTEQVARNVCNELLDAGLVERRQDGRAYRYWVK